MMTQDRATGQPMATPASPRLLNNLNPTAQPFRQAPPIPQVPNTPKNLNPSAPVFQQPGDKSPSEVTYLGQEAGSSGLLTNGDKQSNGTTYSVVSMVGSGSSLHRGGPISQLQSPQPGATPMGLTVASHPATGSAVSQQQTQAPYLFAAPDSMHGQLLLRQQQRILLDHAGVGNGEPGDNQPMQSNGALMGGGHLGQPVGGGGEEEAEEGGEAEVANDQGVKYPDSLLEPIRKQMQFYMSAENLPNDKYLNSKMDSDKFIPLEIFMQFNRMKPICSTFEQLAQAIESSSVLELDESRTRVRVSQCRKTLTLRGFPANANDEDIRRFILDMGASPPTHIELVMMKDKLTTWYVSFRDETIALDCFQRLHNNKAEYRGYPIGCCIKSSGTLAAAGYFPSSEESNQRRMAHQNHVAVSNVNQTAAPTVLNTMAQPQPPQVMQSYNPMPLYNSIMPTTTGSYYQLAANPYMPYMASMIAPGWPAHTAMEPGIIMQSNGLQPQNIRTNIARPHVLPQSSGNQHRFNKPQRSNRQQLLERSASERSSDRGSVVSVSSSNQSRSSPRSVDGNSGSGMVQQGGSGYMQRRPRDEGAQVLSPQQVSSNQHQYVTPLVSQQPPQPHSTTAQPSTIVNPSNQEVHIQHFQQAQSHPMIVQPALTVPTTAPPMPTPQTSNPPPLTPQHHHPQLPPPIHHIPHHQQQPPQPPHHHQQSGHHPHNVGHQQPPPPPPSQQPHHHHHHHHHQQSLQSGNHHPHPHSMIPPPHHTQPHHQMSLPSHHQQQQPSMGNRPDRRNRRNRRDENVRSQRNQSNRMIQQSSVATDNFTMEDNSFPPLPGTANIANPEVALENKWINHQRPSGSSSSGTNRAPSTTPSPVATPAPVSAVSSSPAGHPRLTSVDAQSGADDVESVVDDDTSSSLDDPEIDEPRSTRSDTFSLALSEPLAIPGRSQKASTPVATPVSSSYKQGESRHIHNQNSTQSRAAHLPTQQQHQIITPAFTGTSLPQEAPKPSYAQMVAQKNREANGVIDVLANAQTISSGNINGPATVVQSSNNAATQNPAVRTTSQSTNAFREQGNRSAPRGSSKDNMARVDGPQPSSRPLGNGGRRNSKENRSTKFDRRKPDVRPK